jgi:type IX secretion system PorP/SprF family membrane protein
MNFKRAYIIAALVVLFSGFGYSQQDPQISQYMFNKVFYNPGAAGSGQGICINGLVRQQWAGFKDAEGNKVAPESFLITADAPLNVLHGGLSLIILQDKIGFWQDIDLKLGYTYRANLGPGTLGVGLQFGFFNRTVDFILKYNQT